MLRTFDCAAVRACLLVLLGTAAFCAPSALRAQSQTMYRIGYMLPPTEENVRSHTEGFLKGLREHGYVVGKNVQIDYRFAEYKLDRLPALAKELVALEPDVIVTASPPGVRAVQQATHDIPIVIGAVYDPVGLGFVKSLARPGGNITGMSVQYEDTIPKLLELLNAVVPQARRIAVLQTVDRSHDRFVARITKMAQPLRISVEAFTARKPADIEPAFASISAAKSDALLVLPHPLFNTRSAEVVEHSMALGLPGIYPFSTYAESGGMMSLGVDLPDSFRRAAYFVHRILRGASPSELPVEQPTKIDLVINLKTAKKLGVEIPPDVLLRADRVIQ